MHSAHIMHREGRYEVTQFREIETTPEKGLHVSPKAGSSLVWTKRLVWSTSMNRCWRPSRAVQARVRGLQRALIARAAVGNHLYNKPTNSQSVVTGESQWFGRGHQWREVDRSLGGRVEGLLKDCL